MSLEAIVDLLVTKIYPAFLVVFFFGLTIFIHELGHFWVAKRRGMKIERFSIGFGPKIFGWTRNGIDYRVSWIPFGGYVALPQMSPMETIEGKTESKAEDLPPAPASSKIAVAIAGPVMNVALAIVLATLVWKIGLPTPVNPSVVGWVEPGSREEQLGIRPGDRLVALNGEKVKTWMEVHRIVALSREPTARVVIERDGTPTEYLLETEVNEVLGLKTLNLFSEGRPIAGAVLPDSPAAAAGVQPGDEFLAVNGVPVATRQELIDLISDKPGQEITMRIIRNGEVLTLSVIPRWQEQAKVAQIGVQLDDKLEYQVVRPGPTPGEQFRDILGMMRDTFYALVHSKETGVGARSLSGPVGIMGGWWHEIIHGGIMRGVWFAVLLNLNLAIINLLPLPVLDGGHIVFSLIEAVRRKPMNAKLVQNLSVAFAVLLIGFMLYVTFFDFQRFFGRPKSSSSAPVTNQAPSAPTSEPAPVPAP